MGIQKKTYYFWPKNPQKPEHAKYKKNFYEIMPKTQQRE